MPILRWFGFKGTMSLPSMRIAPLVGVSKPATMRSTVVLPQPDGPSSETNSPLSMFRLKSLTTRVGPKDFSRCSISRKAISVELPYVLKSG